MKKASQDKHILKIDTPLGKDVFHITKAEIQEGISMLFSIQASTYTNGQLINANDIIGKSVSITLKHTTGGALVEKYYNGVVTAIRSVGSRVPSSAEGEKYQDYVLDISPTCQFLTQRTNCRIFQKLNVIEIVQKIFGEHAVRVKTKVEKTYPVYDYKVQYHESDLDFVHRLLEQEGLFYFFTHEKDAHYIVLADNLSAYSPCTEAEVSFTTGSLAEAHIHTWSSGLEVVPGSSVKQAYDFIKPTSKPKGQSVDAELVPQQAQTEVYEYLAESEFLTRTQNMANFAVDALQRDAELSSGGSNCCSFSAGQFFAFKSHEDERLIGKDFLITQLHMEVAIATQTGSNSHSAQTLKNQFTCVPKETLYRPLPLTSKPRVYGAQTARVTGDEGDEICIDKYGRVKVLFHWDREGLSDSTSSCWIRVAQNWAGNRWGAFFFPRVGQEVLVEFLDGDPDQPIISGALYNGDQMPPYDLPAQKSVSGIKSRSTKQGTHENFNEIRFDDAKGNELFYMHAEKDHYMHVENDQQVIVDRDALHHVVNNLTVKVDNNVLHTVKNNQTETIGKELVIDAGSKIVLKSGGSSITLTSDGKIDIKGNSVSINGSTITMKAGKISLN
ncbi:type VI secretion system tip protein TssI/VgrG [Photobacterium aphoticum]|uniref:Type IV secretion protein Rhs n=1 Tax=Photobacterium aphoticum TaxID=754436 RepID=A0A0J1GS68_9GAMM|nr:type VI secretion system tip protein TssI/VgrG [Photobacterium aphoticum]KLV02264.1 type IV secretion protein Rhs [Photobacterium aphoticum]PSU57757.1 type VI secretion system tip protein VgrG [Photobacterium aphoticum]GHA55029.1 type IV secretion protein Rhs [Photobacterium aphoticum]